MRNTNEIKAEIFSRSSKIIALRRKRKKYMALGLMPLCLCVAVSLIFSFGDAAFKNVTSDQSSFPPPANGDEEAYRQFDVEFFDSSLNSKITVSDSGKAVTIKGRLDSIIANHLDLKDDGADLGVDITTSFEEVGPATETQSSANGASTDNSLKEEAFNYKITLVFENGTREEYSVDGKVLTDPKGRKIPITDQELKELLNLIKQERADNNEK